MKGIAFIQDSELKGQIMTHIYPIFHVHYFFFYITFSHFLSQLSISCLCSLFPSHFLMICSGLVATIKEHITKPTAMAQGRVAHLIEWKGWGGETATGGGWCGWSRDGGGWGGAGATLQEDEQLYSHLTDEIKEARFAAG